MANKIDWDKDCKDVMWSMFWLGENQNSPEREQFIENDKEAIRENVARLIRMTTQKDAGQRKSKSCISWDSLTPTIMAILCATTRLALDGAFGEMPEYVQEE